MSRQKGKKQTFRVLAIDGGGIKGIAAATMLAELEEKTGKHCSELFDMFVLSSTGAIIGLFLLIPSDEDPTKPKYWAKDIVEMYRNDGPGIFNKRLLHEFRGLIKEKKYSAENLHKLARTYFAGTRAKSTIKPFIIPLYDIERKKKKRIWVTNIPNLKFTEFYPEMDLSELLIGATAAQTLFPAKAIYTRVTEKVDGKDDPVDRMIKIAATDGSIFASMNAPHAYEMALEVMPEDSELILVSVGTGYEHESHTLEKWNAMGKLELASTLVMQLMSESLAQFEEYLRDKLGDNYYRLNGPLSLVSPAPKNDLDNVDQVNMDALEKFGRAVVETHPRFVELCHVLRQKDATPRPDLRTGDHAAPTLKEIANDMFLYAVSKLPKKYKIKMNQKPRRLNPPKKKPD